MAKSKQDEVRPGLYCSADGKTVVAVDRVNFNLSGITYVKYWQVIPPPSREDVSAYLNRLPLEWFRKSYPLFVDKCVVE